MVRTAARTWRNFGLAARHLPHHAVQEIGDQKPAVGGYCDPGGLVELGVGGRAIVAGVPRGAGARDLSDHPAADTLRTTLLKSSANSNPPSVDRPAH